MKIGFIGAGRMAQALAGGIAKSKICEIGNMTISDPNPDAIAAFRSCVGTTKVAADNFACSKNVDFLFLAVKPQYFHEASDGIDLSGSNTTVVSVMGGIKIKQIRKALKTDNVVRVMPNTPCLVGAGACGLTVHKDVDTDQTAIVSQMLESLGIVVPCPESQLDAITGLSGSGPAYVFTFIEALADGGVKMGLSREQAHKLATQTVLGAAKMVADSGDHPAVLRDRVASPGGTTIHGIHALEEGGFRSSVIDAVQAAAERSIDLGS